MPNDLDINLHLAVIDRAVTRLGELDARARAPAPIQHQYVGTVLDSTVVLLCATANTLDSGARTCSFTEARNWLSLQEAVHRSFLSSLHTAIEAALSVFCREHGIVVCASRHDEAQRLLDELKRALAPGSAQQTLLDLGKHFRGLNPEFRDYLEAALNRTTLSKAVKREWRAFFHALAIVRNKCSHAETSLTSDEADVMCTAGLDAMLSQLGELVVSPERYCELAQRVLSFFDILLASAAGRSAPPEPSGG